MKALLVGESRQGKLLESTSDLLEFAGRIKAEKVMLLIGLADQIPQFNGRIYLADAARAGEYNPDLHKRLVLDVAAREKPELIVFLHSSYGWDLAPRVAGVLKISQISEVIGLMDDLFIVSACNSKLRRYLKPSTTGVVLTLQTGAFGAQEKPTGTPQVIQLEIPDVPARMEFIGYEISERKAVDLTKAEIIVSAGRGIGKKENVGVVAALASALGGELAATRPVVDAGWVEASRQVGSSGQTVAPRLYIACGISGAIQHLAGMKKSGFIVAVNKDREAPIGDVADVLVIADVMQFVPALIERLKQ